MFSSPKKGKNWNKKFCLRKWTKRKEKARNDTYLSIINFASKEKKKIHVSNNERWSYQPGYVVIIRWGSSCIHIFWFTFVFLFLGLCYEPIVCTICNNFLIEVSALWEWTRRKLRSAENRGRGSNSTTYLRKTRA